MFPDTATGSAATFLPAAGCRDNSGSAGNQGSFGYYWSSEAYSSSYGYYLNFTSFYVYPLRSGDYAVGFPVRCVRQ
jgi:uncharacterized protein (TIGR02145 family)